MWNDAYSDSSSAEYGVLSRELTDHLTAVLTEAYTENFLQVEVTDIRQGSVIFDFIVYLKITSSISENNLKDVIKKGEGGMAKFTVTDVSIKLVFPCKSLTRTTEKPETGLERWIIVLIASGAVIVLLLILVLIVVVSHF